MTTNNVRELRDRRAQLLDQAQQLVSTAEGEDRDFSEDEQSQFDGLIDDATSLEARISRLENMPTIPQRGNGNSREPLSAPNLNRTTRLGDNEANAFRSFYKFGDVGGLSHLRSQPEEGESGAAGIVTLQLPLTELRHGEIPLRAEKMGLSEMRAVDSTMNITTAADGGATVPTGLAPRIAQRMGEIRLTDRLGCQLIPGQGTTVNHTYENADAVIFATTSEQADNLSTNDYERDAMVLANKAFTLVKKTKKLNLTEELLDDTGENLEEAISNWIGRGIALTHNSMLITEVAANGTSLKTYASATAIAAGEPEDFPGNDTLGFYLDDAAVAKWVTRHTTFWNIASLTGNSRLYGEQQLGSVRDRTLLGYPVFFSNYATATAASAKDLYFGNWFYVGYREDPALRLIRDPYSEDGVVVLKYSFRIVYGVLIAGAIGYGVHPTG